jgi:hypothetical protein
MDASTQDNPIDLAPFNAPAVRVRADRLAKPQELHVHTNPINPPLTSSPSSAAPNSSFDAALYHATMEKITLPQPLPPPPPPLLAQP